VIIGLVENYGANADDAVSHNTIFPTGWKIK